MLTWSGFFRFPCVPLQLFLSVSLSIPACPFYSSSTIQEPPANLTVPICAPCTLGPLTLSLTKPTQVGLLTLCAMLYTGWPMLLAALSFLLSTNLSNVLFGNVLCALQSLAWAATSHMHRHGELAEMPMPHSLASWSQKAGSMFDTWQCSKKPWMWDMCFMMLRGLPMKRILITVVAGFSSGTPKRRKSWYL